MACFYVIYKYVFSEWRSIRPVEINQYDITMSTHYDITRVMTLLGIPIVKSQWVMMLLGTSKCDVIMSNDVVMCTLYLYHGITIYNELLQTSFIMYYYA